MHALVGVNSHICQHVTHPAYPLCIPVQTQPLGPREQPPQYVSLVVLVKSCKNRAKPLEDTRLVRGSFISAPYVTAIALPPPRVTDNTLRPLGPVSTGPHSAARRAENRITTHDTTHTHVLRRTCSGRISNSMSLVSHSTLMQLLSPGLSPCGAHTTGRAVAQSPEGHDGPHPHPTHAMTRPRPVTSPRID